MQEVYIDPITFVCHTVQNAEGSRIPYETGFFDGKCQTFIEGYRCIPLDYSWTREDGLVFHGEMIAPFKPYGQLTAAQAQYEADLAEAAAAYQEGVESVWT